MNKPNINVITLIATEVHPRLIYHPTTIAYIQFIFGQYLGAPETITNAKINLVDAMLPIIIERSGNIIQYTGDNIVLPWDVQRVVAMGHPEELTKALGVMMNDVTLPVTVTIENKQFTHMLSAEFTCGLLLFSLVSNLDFHLTLFDVPFTKEYLITDKNRRSRFNVNDDDDIGAFSVNISNVKYTFTTPDFMQGFATGALWAGVDHHLYWSNLVQHTEDLETDDIVDIPISF